MRHPRAFDRRSGPYAPSRCDAHRASIFSSSCRSLGTPGNRCVAHARRAGRSSAGGDVACADGSPGSAYQGVRCWNAHQTLGVCPQCARRDGWRRPGGQVPHLPHRAEQQRPAQRAQSKHALEHRIVQVLCAAINRGDGPTFSLNSPGSLRCRRDQDAAGHRARSRPIRIRAADKSLTIEDRMSRSSSSLVAKRTVTDSEQQGESQHAG
jgi:hypothetical protein